MPKMQLSLIKKNFSKPIFKRKFYATIFHIQQIFIFLMPHLSPETSVIIT